MKSVPEGWRSVELAECAKVERGKFAHRPRNEPRFYGGKMPFVQTGEVSNARGVIKSYSQTLSEEGIAISKVFPKGTLLMTIAANIGNVAELGFDSACPDSLVAILPYGEVCHGYLRRFLETQKSRIHYLAPQNAQKNINVDFLEMLPVLLPPSGEQQKISDIFDVSDAAAEKLGDLLAANAERKQRLMQQLLTGKTRFKEFKGERWRTYRLGELLQEVDRYVTFDDDHTYKLASIRRRSEGLFFRQALQGNQIKTKVMKTIRTGDFLLSKMQVVHGAWGLVTPEFDGMFVSDSYISLVPRNGSALKIEFLNYLSQMRFLRHLAYICSHGVHIEKMTFNLDDFLHEKITIPPTVEEQTKIVGVLSVCDREIGLLQKQLEALKEQKRGLMQKLLTGEVRVKV